MTSRIRPIGTEPDSKQNLKVEQIYKYRESPFVIKLDYTEMLITIIFEMQN